MNNKDYKTDFEEQRKEIDLNNGTDDQLPSRIERHGRQRKSKKSSNHTMINIILGVFAFIPILIFAFVIYNFYFGSDSGSASDKSDVTMDISPGKTAGSVSIVDDSDKEENSDSAKIETNTGAGKPPVSVNPPANGKDDVSDGKEKPEVKPETKPQAKPEVKPETKPQVKPETKPQVKPETKPQRKPETKPETKPQSATHIVAANETLYRISMNYYGSDVGVEKIRKANGLSSNDIWVGQKLIIPK